MNSGVDAYLIDGCGRCAFGGTPQCKVNTWPEELVQLRTILLASGLKEELKWDVPCYTHMNSNIAIMSAFKEYCAISFFRGALLSDTHDILEKPGENTQSARLIKFTNVEEITSLAVVIKSYIQEAIEVEKAGLKVDFKEKDELVFPEEFLKILDENPALKTAFEALTPGRQRAYNLYFSAPKQSKTRESRIEKCIRQILNGEGLNDNYRANLK